MPFKALRTAQLQLDAEKSHTRQLEEKNAILEANKQCKSKKRNVPEELAVYEAEMKSLAKKYGVMIEMFFPTTEALSQPLPVPPPTFNTADHYATTVAEGQCLVAELESILPDHIKRLRPSNHFHDVVRSFIAANRFVLVLINCHAIT